MIKVKKAKPVSARQIKAVQWLRKTHGWIGLWGATLGLLFGFSGIWLNHRDTLKLPMAQQRSSEQLQLPDPAPADAQACVDDIDATGTLGRAQFGALVYALAAADLRHYEQGGGAEESAF